MPLVRILEVELYPTLLSKARSFGLSDDWVQVCFLPNASSFFFLGGGRGCIFPTYRDSFFALTLTFGRNSFILYISFFHCSAL